MSKTLLSCTGCLYETTEPDLMKQHIAKKHTQSPTAGDDKELQHRVFLTLCKLTGTDDEDHQETESEALATDIIMQMVNAYILAQVNELLQSEWLDVYSIASSPQGAVAQAKANYKSQLEAAAQARFGAEEGKHNVHG